MNPTERARMRIRAIMAKFPSEEITLSRKTLDSYGQPTGTPTVYATLRCWRTTIKRGDGVAEKDAGMLHEDEKGLRVVLLDVTESIWHGDTATIGGETYTVTNIFHDSVDARTELTLV